MIWIASRLPADSAAAPGPDQVEFAQFEHVVKEPAKQVQLRVRGAFSDGSTRDVTGLAVYETANRGAKINHDGLVERQSFGETTVLVRFLQQQTPVRLAFVPARASFKWQEVRANNYIDEHIFSKLRRLRMNASRLCSDEIFLRRAFLDLVGILPTADEARRFTAEAARSPGKARQRLIEALFERSEFADYWALKWADLLRVEAHSLDQKGVQNFHHWIRQSIVENKPINEFARALIMANGSTYRNPAANFYRPTRDPAARAKAAAQVFLGTRLQCAECHNHPFERWTQDDYYDWAGLFSHVNYKVLQNDREISSDQHEWKGEQVVFASEKGTVKNPRTGKDAVPRFLGAGGSNANEGQFLGALADWLTSPTNRTFARVQVNRIWFHLMGRGLVDPPDDFRATNPASHPELLEALARDFVRHNFDMRYVIRLIMNSRAYQLSSEPNETNGDDAINYSHAILRRLDAEQLLDCQSQVTGVPLKFPGYPHGMRAAELPGVRPESKGKRRASEVDLLLELLGKPPRLMNSDSERSCECNMGQAFQMISGPTVNELLAEKKNRISDLLASGKSDRDIVTELFWTAMTRAPRESELSDLLKDLESATDRRAALEDILWGLLNSKEFVFRR